MDPGILTGYSDRHTKVPISAKKTTSPLVMKPNLFVEEKSESGRERAGSIVLTKEDLEKLSHVFSKK